MKITNEQITKLINAYNSNMEILIDLENWIEENGCSSEGLSDATESFEQGWNNAMEYVFMVLGI